MWIDLEFHDFTVTSQLAHERCEIKRYKRKQGIIFTFSFLLQYAF